MEKCTRCGADLQWHESRMVFWNSQLKKGYIKWYVMGSPQFGKRKEFPEYKGKKLCQICAYELFTGEIYARPSQKKPTQETGEKVLESQEVAVITDFAALREALTKNGVVMSAYKCPKCGNMVDIPEAGRLLICKHCGEPIKPDDICQKIRVLLHPKQKNSSNLSA